MATRIASKVLPGVAVTALGYQGVKGYAKERDKNPNATVMSYGTKLGTELSSRLSAARAALMGKPSAKVGAPTIVLPPLDTTSLTEVENLFEQTRYALTRAKTDKAQNPGLTNSFNIIDNPMKTKNFSDVQSAAQWFKTFFPALKTYRNPTTLSGAEKIITAAEEEIKKAADKAAKASTPGYFSSGKKEVILQGGRRRHRKQTRRKTRRNRRN